MKKLFLFLITLFSFIGVQAQTFFSEGSARGDSAFKAGNGDIAVYNMLRAATGTVTVRWRVIGSSSNLAVNNPQPGMWTFGGLCDNIACRDSSLVLSGASFEAIYGTLREDFHAIFHSDNATVNSSAWIRVSVMDTAAGGTSRTLTMVATKTPLGVTTTIRNDDNIKVYPNPARESVNVSFENSDNIRTVGVYNLLGQPISMFHIVGSSANIPLNDAPAGVYFLRMYDGQGKIVATRRFTRQ